MKKIYQVLGVWVSLMVIILIPAFMFAVPSTFAEEDQTQAAPGVAGCTSVAVDPESTLEFQQGICQAAEGNPVTSCAASNSGTCSSPKLNDTLPQANHCVCISETPAEPAI